MVEKVIVLLILINFLAVAIVILKMLVKERRKAKTLHLLNKMKEFDGKLEEYRSPPNYGEYKRFCEQLKKRENDQNKKHSS
jgi:hypothetical protein